MGLGTAQEVSSLWLDDTVDPSLRTRLDDCSAKAIGLGHSPKKASDAYGPGIWVLRSSASRKAPDLPDRPPCPYLAAHASLPIPRRGFPRRTLPSPNQTRPSRWAATPAWKRLSTCNS